MSRVIDLLKERGAVESWRLPGSKPGFIYLSRFSDKNRDYTIAVFVYDNRKDVVISTYYTQAEIEKELNAFLQDTRFFHKEIWIPHKNNFIVKSAGEFLWEREEKKTEKEETEQKESLSVS